MNDPANQSQWRPGTAGNMIRLAGSLLLELVSSAFQIVLFLFRRGAERRRIRALLLGPYAPRAEGRRRRRLPRAAVTACLAILVLAGCCGPGIYSGGGQQPGTQFSKEIDELVWSTVMWVRMPDWKDSLSDDLEDFVGDDPCHFTETFELWGW